MGAAVVPQGDGPRRRLRSLDRSQTRPGLAPPGGLPGREQGAVQQTQLLREIRQGLVALTELRRRQVLRVEGRLERPELPALEPH